MTKLSKITDRKPLCKGGNTFGFTDDKGRDVGAVHTIFIETYEPQDDGVLWGSLIEPGTYWHATVTVSRAGEAFGASQVGRRCKSLTEALEYISGRVADIRKRQAKKFT